MSGPINPIDEVGPNRQPGDRAGVAAGEVSFRKQEHGEVISVRRRSGHHEEGHVLDATVGESTHDEIVIRVTRGSVDGIAGKRVIVSIE